VARQAVRLLRALWGNRMTKPDKYTLNGREPVPCFDLMAWAALPTKMVQMLA
jgi:hypothetical protein